MRRGGGGTVAREHGARLLQRDLVRARVDLEQHLAGTHLLPFREAHGDDGAAHPRLKRDARERLDGAVRRECERHRAGGRDGDDDGDLLRIVRLCVAVARGEGCHPGESRD